MYLGVDNHICLLSGASKYVPKPGDHVAFNLTEIQPIDG